MTYSRWYKRHSFSFDHNQEYAVRLLKDFGIIEYHFSANGYGCDLILKYNGIYYKLEVDDSMSRIYISKKTITRKGLKHPKEYWREVASYGTDCIYNSLLWIKKNG